LGKVRHPSPPPLRTNDVRPVAIGTVLWGVAFLALLPFHARLEDHGVLWWIPACASGFLLGLVGLAYVRRRASHDGPSGEGS
jgi:hypothetical protein